jgi:hypothetical protein
VQMFSVFQKLHQMLMFSTVSQWFQRTTICGTQICMLQEF